jgi:hypothetical protein
LARFEENTYNETNNHSFKIGTKKKSNLSKAETTIIISKQQQSDKEQLISKSRLYLQQYNFPFTNGSAEF